VMARPPASMGRNKGALPRREREEATAVCKVSGTGTILKSTMGAYWRWSGRKFKSASATPGQPL